MSRSGFSERFSSLVGNSAKSDITNWRMEVARKELINNNSPISVVAGEFGYSSEAAFSRAFTAASVHLLVVFAIHWNNYI